MSILLEYAVPVAILVLVSGCVVSAAVVLWGGDPRAKDEIYKEISKQNYRRVQWRK